MTNLFQSDSRWSTADILYSKPFSSQTLGGLLLNEAFRCFHLFVLCRTLSLISSQFRMCHKICLISSFGEVKTKKKNKKKMLFRIFENCVSA